MTTCSSPIAGSSPARSPSRWLAALVLVLGATLGCDGEAEVKAVPDWGGGPRSPYVPAGYELAFEDNFDALTLVDSGEERGWGTHFLTFGVRHLEGNDDKAMKVDAAYLDQVAVGAGQDPDLSLHQITADGSLKLFGRPTPEALIGQEVGFPYIGGMISGEPLFAQRFGYWEFRVRLHHVPAGAHWAFWLLPDDHSWPPEIDLLEVIGSNPKNPEEAGKFFFNSLTGEDDSITMLPPPRGLDAWYTIGFLWTEEAMVWLVDGEEVRRRPNLFSDKSLYFLISPEIGDRWPGEPPADAVWPTEVEVDYIRVYRAS
jgi:hypothetical protein